MTGVNESSFNDSMITPSDTEDFLVYCISLDSTDIDANHSCYHILQTFLDAEYGGSLWGWHFIMQILYCIVCLVGLAGNTLVIYVVVRFSKMQTVTNLYIVNLAIADECFLIGIPFLLVTTVVGYWPFGKILCKAYFITTSINQITSSMFLLIMSADRYLAVCHPINATKWRTPLIAKVVALTAWTMSALLMVPISMYTNTLEVHNKTNCNIFWPDQSSTMSGDKIFMIYSFVFAFAIPVALILIFYVMVIRRLKTVGPKRKPQSSKSVGSSGDRDIQQIQQQTSRAKERKKSHRKVTKLVLTVITIYFLSWAPYWASQMALVFMSPDTKHSPTVLMIFLLAGCLSYTNSAMNPILYAFLSDNFKKSFKKACSCATNRDFNTTTVNNENSIFPRRKGSSYRRHRKPSAPLTSATYAGTTCPEMTTSGTSITRTTMLHPSTSSIHQPSPPLSTTKVPVSKLIPDIEESDDGNASETFLTNGQNSLIAILVPTTGASNLGGSRLNPQQNNFGKPSYSDMVTIASVNETFVQDNGVIVTAL